MSTDPVMQEQIKKLEEKVGVLTDVAEKNTMVLLQHLTGHAKEQMPQPVQVDDDDICDQCGSHLDDDGICRDNPECGSHEEKVDSLDEIRGTSISDLELSYRARKYLDRKGICTVGQLMRTNEDTISSIYNIGRVTLNDIKDKLRELGVVIGMDLPPKGSIASTITNEPAQDYYIVCQKHMQGVKGKGCPICEIVKLKSLIREHIDMDKRHGTLGLHGKGESDAVYDEWEDQVRRMEWALGETKHGA